MALPIEAAPDLAAAPVDEMSDEEFYANIRKVFGVLLKFRGMTPNDLADAMKIGRSTLYGKLQTGKFTAGEVRHAARALRVRIDAFYQPADSLLSSTIIRCYMQEAGGGTHLHGQLEIDFAPPPALALVPS